MSDRLPHMLRSDARQNRDRVLDAARALFSERGLDVPIREIVRDAWAGQDPWRGMCSVVHGLVELNAQNQGFLDDFVLVLIAGRGLSAAPPDVRLAAARRFSALTLEALRASPTTATLPPPARVAPAILAERVVWQVIPADKVPHHRGRPDLIHLGLPALPAGHLDTRRTSGRIPTLPHEPSD